MVSVTNKQTHFLKISLQSMRYNSPANNKSQFTKANHSITHQPVHLSCNIQDMLAYLYLIIISNYFCNHLQHDIFICMAQRAAVHIYYIYILGKMLLWRLEDCTISTLIPRQDHTQSRFSVKVNQKYYARIFIIYCSEIILIQ